jgi:hypothetical protein
LPWWPPAPRAPNCRTMSDPTSELDVCAPVRVFHPCPLASRGPPSVTQAQSGQGDRRNRSGTKGSRGLSPARPSPLPKLSSANFICVSQ